MTKWKLFDDLYTFMDNLGCFAKLNISDIDIIIAKRKLAEIIEKYNILPKTTEEKLTKMAEEIVNMRKVE